MTVPTTSSPLFKLIDHELDAELELKRLAADGGSWLCCCTAAASALPDGHAPIDETPMELMPGLMSGTRVTSNSRFLRLKRKRTACVLPLPQVQLPDTGHTSCMILPVRT